MARARAACPGFAQALARTMRDSLLGNPQTIFVQNPEGKGGYSYTRAKSQNADWWQELPKSIERPELRHAIDLLEAGEPLKPRRREHRWLAAFVKRARKEGWCATFGDKVSPICLDPDRPMKRGRAGKDARRVFLTLPEAEYSRILGHACALHESPNAFLQALIPEALDIKEVSDRESAEGF